MLMAMMPGSSSDFVLLAGMSPLVVITRPKTNTNIIGCSSVCSSSGTRLRRATCASRASIARKVLQIHSRRLRPV